MPLSLLLLAFLPLILCAPPPPSLPSEGQIIMIDAGSSGSRLHIHAYSFTSKLPLIHPSQNKKLKPGLSSFVDSPTELDTHVALLLDYAREIIPISERPRTPIHLQATAGLRSIKPRDAITIRDRVRVLLSESEFAFKDEWCRIISGSQEGLNGWLATNYLLGSFLEDDNETHGVVEMGGYSMQITFAPQNPTTAMKAKLAKIMVAGKEYYIYTHSFLQYGLQAAEHLFQSLNIDAIEESGNPCYPRGSKHSANGNFQKCEEWMNKLVDKSKRCIYESCSFNGIFQPIIKKEPFLAIENFFYTAKFFGHVTETQSSVEKGNQLTDALKEKGTGYCNQDWQTILQIHKGEDERELEYYCFAAAYQRAVLEKGFGFNHLSNIRAARIVNGKAIDWELGATLIELIRNTMGNMLDINEKKEDLVAVEPPLDIYGDVPQAPYTLKKENGNFLVILLILIAVAALVFCAYQRFFVKQRRSSPLKYSYEKVVRDVMNKV